MKKIFFITVAMVLVFAAGTFAFFYLGKDGEKEQKPIEITLTQTETDYYRDFIFNGGSIAAHFVKGTMNIEPRPHSNDLEEEIRFREQYQTKIIEVEGIEGGFYPVSPDAPYQSLEAMVNEASKYFTKEAVEYLLSKNYYTEQNGKLYVQPVGEPDSMIPFDCIKLSADAEQPAKGEKTIFAQSDYPEGEYDEKITFIIEDGTEKIDKMCFYGIYVQ